MLKEAFPAGTLKVIYGPMHSGKSGELLRLLDRVKFTSKQVKVFQPKIDTRSNGISSKFIPDRIYETNLIDHPLDIFKLDLSCHIIAFDEAQFFSDSLFDTVKKLISQNYHVIVCGLDKNFRAEGFNDMPDIIKSADEKLHLKAICEINDCDYEATLTQRLINNLPAKYGSPTVLIERENISERYEARCEKCYQMEYPFDKNIPKLVL
ncbi:MAG: Thymidine kinase [Candidatus Heimdallarchaeota archaeon LC_3]|nr:MAG: Thymidine kinase [Candidatus Heimdallarchaeota archaeon LC_3]